MKCFFIFLPCSLTFSRSLFHLFSLHRSPTDRSYSWPALLLMGKADIANRGGIWARLKPKPASSSWACAPVCHCAIRTSDLLSAVCMTKKAFLGRVFEKGRTKQRGRSFPFSKRRSILNKFLEVITHCTLFIAGLAIIEYQPVYRHYVRLCQLILARDLVASWPLNLTLSD